ncbi:hypothetical protein BBP40_003811 [Aspergillus hancockii]|nr:hypothetical protein BBP40_003811 [Aspergillus hancockii]
MLDDYGALIEDGRIRVLDHGGHIKGILAFIPQEDTMLLDNVAVASSARGTGLGCRLIHPAEQSAREAGYRTIRLYTNEAMVENVAMYLRLGYFETHRVEEKG